jgi:DNA replication and repair protein RecF
VLVRERREGSSSRFRKLASINGKPYPSSLQYLNQRFGNAALGFHAISFNPADHDLIRGEPATRRAYLDRVLAAEDSEYLATLRRYLKLVEQRNSLLKQNSPPSRPLLEGFTEPLAPLAATLVRQRLEWMSRLTQTLTETARKIAPEQGDLRLRYLSRWIPEKSEFSRNNRLLEAQHFSGLPHLPSLQILEDYFRKGMTRAAQTGAEARAKSTLVGPHRDDWSLDLSGFPLSHQPADFLKCESSTQEPRSLKGHGSQGEIRTALLALKLSEIALFRQKTGHKPLLLLDDFSSELDQRRRQFLLRFLAETDLQVFVTATELPADCGLTDLGRGTRYEVRQGKIKPL